MTKARNYLPMSDIRVYIRNKNFGLKSINGSLSITTALRPWLLNDLNTRALALILLINHTGYSFKLNQEYVVKH